MSEPFLGEIKIVAFGFAPKGWAFCNGQLLPINQNQALFSLLGTTYGGDGRTNFALPDLRERVPIHVGNGHLLGQMGGEQAHTLSLAELSDHSHILMARNDPATFDNPMGNVLARPTQNAYTAPAALASMVPAAIANTGGGQAHLNMQPFLGLNFCIALQGIFPSRN